MYIQKRTPEIIIKELRQEIDLRVKDAIELVKDMRVEDREAFRYRCMLFAYEDIQSLLSSLEEEEEVDTFKEDIDD